MLYNKLVYTAVTRAKNKLILIGDPNSFIYGIKNDYIDFCLLMWKQAHSIVCMCMLGGGNRC